MRDLMKMPSWRFSCMTLIALMLSILTGWTGLEAQTRVKGEKTIVAETVEVDKMIHDFGDVMISEKMLHCSFHIKNISKKPIVIFNVASSCGCTNIRWTREPLTPGKTGEIQVDYTNDAGPYPFDKTLTVYISGLKKPVILRLRGMVHEKKKPLNEIYPIQMGTLGMKTTDIKLGNLKQGDSKGDSFQIANLGSHPLKLAFAEVSAGLELEVSPNPIPAHSTATVKYTVSADENTWGKNYYWFTPLVNSQPTHQKVGIWSFTIKDFSDWSKEDIKNASQPLFQSSSFTFPKTRKGKKINARFSFANKGKSNAIIYKIDCDWPDSQVRYEKDIAPGSSSEINVELDTSKMPEGDVMWTVLLTTNCPLRPYITLYIYGNID